MSKNIGVTIHDLTVDEVNVEALWMLQRSSAGEKLRDGLATLWMEAAEQVLVGKFVEAGDGDPEYSATVEFEASSSKPAVSQLRNQAYGWVSRLT